jgi:hypothetical protein
VSGKRVLLADPDPTVAGRLGPGLRASGWLLQVAADGAAALQAAILRPPMAVVFDEACALLDPEAFERLLRSNPRTARLPMLVVGDGPRAELLRPSRAEGLLAWLRKVEEASAIEIEGHLSQLSLVDLLQIFSQHRRSGTIDLRFPDELGTLIVSAGRLVAIHGTRYEGEKALFRWLERQDGSFEFHPAREGAAELPGQSVDHLIMEAMRQTDELGALRKRLPPRLELAGEGEGEELLELLADGPRSLDELLDRTTAPDLEVARRVAALISEGRLVAAQGLESGPILDRAALLLLRQRLGQGQRGKVILADRGQLEQARRLPGYRSVASRGRLGTVGRLEWKNGPFLDLILLPEGEGWRPLRACLEEGSLGRVDPELPLVEGLRALVAKVATEG